MRPISLSKKVDAVAVLDFLINLAHGQLQQINKDNDMKLKVDVAVLALSELFAYRVVENEFFNSYFVRRLVNDYQSLKSLVSVQVGKENQSQNCQQNLASQ